MSVTRISVTDVPTRLASIVDSVLRHGGRYTLERDGVDVAAIVTVADLEQLHRSWIKRPAGAMALVGLWHEVSDKDSDALLDDLRDARDRDTGRSIQLDR